MEEFKTQAVKKPRTNDLHLRPANQSLNSDPTLNKTTKPVVQSCLQIRPFQRLQYSLQPLFTFWLVLFRPQLYHHGLSSRSCPCPGILLVNASQPHVSQMLSKISNLVFFCSALSSCLICYITSSASILIISISSSCLLIAFVAGSSIIKIIHIIIAL